MRSLVTFLAHGVLVDLLPFLFQSLLLGLELDFSCVNTGFQCIEAVRSILDFLCQRFDAIDFFHHSQVFGRFTGHGKQKLEMRVGTRITQSTLSQSRGILFYLQFTAYTLLITKSFRKNQ